MNALYLKYFANVRWVELIMAFGIAVLGDLQLTVQGGGKLDQQSVIKAVGIGAGVAWAYLRMPKEPAKAAEASVDGIALPEGIDATGPADDVAAEIVQEALQALLLPSVGAAAPSIAQNATRELGRVIKRGIVWGGHWKL